MIIGLFKAGGRTMKLCVIKADGRHGDIYFTNNPNNYWSNNIEDAKIYTKGRAEHRIKSMRYNNPRLIPIICVDKE